MTQKPGKPWAEMSADEKADFLREEDRRLYDTFNGETRRLADMIQKQGRRIEELEQKLKDMSKGSDGKILLG
jgi:hypothetical protein